MPEKHGINAEIVRLSLPVAVGMISQTVLNIVDTAMVGRLGDTALGSVGLASFFILVTVMIFGSMSIGTQAITARRLGEGRRGEFKRIVYNSFLLSTSIGIVVSAAGYLLSSQIMALLSSNEEIRLLGNQYLSIRFLGIFSMTAIFSLRGFVYGAARVKIDMIVSVIINTLNIVLNYYLIFGHWFFPRLGVEGAAIASTVSTVVGLVIYASFVYVRIVRHLKTGITENDARAGRAIGKANEKRESIEAAKARSHSETGAGGLLSGALMMQIVRISLPRAVQSVSIIGFVIFLSFIGRIGVKELAISNIIFKAFNFSFMVGLAIGTASATLVGRSLGEKHERLASRYGWHSAAMGSIVMGLIGALFIFFPREIMGVFTTSHESIELGIVPFRLLGVFQFIDGIGIVLSRTLQGTGNTLYVMLSEIFAIWFVMIPFSYYAVAVTHGTITFAWWGLFLYIVTFASAMTWKFKEGGWKKIEI